MTTTTPPGGAPPHAIAADLRRLADTPGHQLTDAYRDGLRTLAGEVAKLAGPAGDCERCGWPGRPPEPTTELDAIAAGLDPEQEIRSRALDAACYLNGDTCGTTNGVANHVIDLAEPLAAWIRTGTRP